MQELWERNKELVPVKEWNETINSLRLHYMPLTNKEEAKKALKKKLISSVKKRIPSRKFGIFFSGGVDSTFIASVCKQFGADFICYTVGFQEDTKEPEDITEAKKAAKELGFQLRFKIYGLKEVEEIIKKTAAILKKVNKTDVINVGVGAVITASVKLAEKDGIDYFLSGLGSEEIFAGYERHSKVSDVNEECWHGLKEMWSRDLVRDFNLARELKITVGTPFLDEDLIKLAMQLPGEWKINKENKKIILREVAEEFMGKFAWRKKKAAQYGSCFDKAIGKLARQNGFKFKGDWLKSL